MQINFSNMKSGDNKQGFLSLDNGYTMPITLIKGATEGLCVAMTAGLHNGEYPSISAFANLSINIDPMKIKENIAFIHCINTSGFWNKSLDVVYEDAQNLNRNFPSDASLT